MIINLFGKKSVAKKAPVTIPSFIRVRSVTYKCRAHKPGFEFAGEGVEGALQSAKYVVCPRCKTAGNVELRAVGEIIKTIPVRGISQ